MASAVHIDRLAGDELARNEVDRRVGDILGSAVALERQRLQPGARRTPRPSPGGGRISPGAIPLTAIPGASSIALIRVSAREHVLAQDVGDMRAVEARHARVEQVDDVTALGLGARSARVSTSGAQALISRLRCKPSSSTVSSVSEGKMEALLTRISIVPSAS